MIILSNRMIGGKMPVLPDPALRPNDENGFSQEALTHSAGGRAALFSRVYGIWNGSRKIARDVLSQISDNVPRQMHPVSARERVLRRGTGVK